MFLKNTIRDGGSTALLTAHTVDAVDTVDTVDTAGVKEYFQIDCRTWVSRGIF